MPGPERLDVPGFGEAEDLAGSGAAAGSDAALYQQGEPADQCQHAQQCMAPLH